MYSDFCKSCKHPLTLHNTHTDKDAELLTWDWPSGSPGQVAILLDGQRVAEELVQKNWSVKPCAKCGEERPAERWLSMHEEDIQDERHIHAMTAEQKARDMIQRITGREDAQQLSAGDVVELANLIAERDAVHIAWVPVSERMPAPNESPSGFFWCWGPTHDMPELLEVYGHEDCGSPGTWFCNSGGSATLGSITHWQPAAPPKAPTPPVPTPAESQHASPSVKNQ